MDVVVDRESIYSNRRKDIKIYLSEVSRVLKKGGVFISFRFSEKDPNLELLETGTILGKKIENNTWKDVESGPFANTGIVHFSNFEEMVLQHQFLEIKCLREHSCLSINNSYSDIGYPFSEYILMGVKK